MPLTNKALVVLELLQEGDERTCKEIGETIEARTPCAYCEGTGQGDDKHFGCRRCYGRGRKLFGYSDAYIALEQLRKRKLVARRLMLDEWGDVTNRFVYGATGYTVNADDPLEALWLASATGSAPQGATPSTTDSGPAGVPE